MKEYIVARPQALTCQGRRRSAAAAHAKGPARPVVQSAFRAKGLWRKTRKFLNFWLISQLFFKTRVALPEATPSRFGYASLFCLRSAPTARRPSPLRPAQLNKNKDFNLNSPQQKSCQASANQRILYSGFPMQVHTPHPFLPSC